MTSSNHRAARTYSSVGVQTRGAQHDQYELALLMFEAVLGNAAAAQGAIAAGDTSGKVQHLHKAVRILQDGLRTSLDLENGGELAQNLANLYDYCILRLTHANARSDEQAVAEVIELIRPVADAWKQMREQLGVKVQPSLPNVGSESTSSAADQGHPPVSKFNTNNLYGSRLGGSLLVGA